MISEAKVKKKFNARIQSLSNHVRIGSDSGGVNLGLVIGLLAAGLVILIAVIISAICFFIRRRSSRAAAHQPRAPNHSG